MTAALLILTVFSVVFWLVFFKFKWLPWNTTSQVTVVVIPIVGLTALILLLNIYAPSSHDVRVFKYTVPVVSQVRGRVIEVPIEEGNRLVHKGDVLFRVDPTPYQLTVNSLKAQLVGSDLAQLDAAERGSGRETRESRMASLRSHQRQGRDQSHDLPRSCVP